jgi:hypothetical protein
MFLPPDTLGGIPCLSIPQDQAFDPYPLAVRMAAELPPPDLRIGMNPARGMVHVPTWFWVEGYDGGTLSQSETVLQAHKICHLVAERGPDGLVTLDTEGRPRTRLDCHTDTTTFVVEVRLWPSHYAWDFGDNHGKDIACAGIGDCPDALGVPFVDARHESPIQHPYLWSSLGVNGAADAYLVRLAITFAADYRVSIDGQDQGGWRGLPARTLTWSASHQVQEAQAVLSRP